MFIKGNFKMENAIGKRVKEIRAELKMSQSQFAESIGVSKSLISLIELGRKNPSVETIDKIAYSHIERGFRQPSIDKLGRLSELYGVPTDELLIKSTL